MYCRYFWLTLVLQLATQMRTHICNVCRRDVAFFLNSGGFRRGLQGSGIWDFFFMKLHQSKQPHSNSDWCLTKTLPSPGSVEEITSLVGLLRNLSSLVSILCTWFYTVLWLIFQEAFHKIFLLPFCASWMTCLHFKGDFPTGKMRMWHTKYHLQEQAISVL